MKIGLIDAKDVHRCGSTYMVVRLSYESSFQSKIPPFKTADSNSRPNDSINDQIIFELKPVL